jgi:hypothetical protein
MEEAIEQFGFPVANQAVNEMQQVLSDSQMCVYTKILRVYELLVRCSADLHNIANAARQQRLAGATEPVNLHTQIVAMPLSLAGWTKSSWMRIACLLDDIRPRGTPCQGAQRLKHTLHAHSVQA